MSYNNKNIEDSYIFSGGLLVDNTIELAPGDTDANKVSCFIVDGVIRVLAIYAICTVENEGPNVTFSNAQFDVFDEATNQDDLTAVVDASGITVDGVISRINTSGNAAAFTDATTTVIEDPSVATSSFFSPFLLVPYSTGEDTVVRFRYTGDANTDLTMKVFMRYEPIDGATVTVISSAVYSISPSFSPSVSASASISPSVSPSISPSPSS